MNIKDMNLTRELLTKYKRELSLRLETFRPQSLPQHRVDTLKSAWRKEIENINYVIKEIDNHKI